MAHRNATMGRRRRSRSPSLQLQTIERLRAAGIPDTHQWRRCMAGVQPRLLLRVESFVITAGLLVLYGRAGGSWVLFFAAILVPDLSILGYAAGPHVGA